MKHDKITKETKRIRRKKIEKGKEKGKEKEEEKKGEKIIETKEKTKRIKNVYVRKKEKKQENK